MSHALDLALVYALVVQSAHLLLAAGGGWATLRGLVLERSAQGWIALAAAIGMALATGAVTGALAPAALTWLKLAGGAALLATVAWVELTPRGPFWRAMAGNAPGLVRAGIAPRPGLPLALGLCLAALAGVAAPAPPTAANWLPLACLALLWLAGTDHRPGLMVRRAVLAFLAGALVGGLALLLPPQPHALVVGFLTLAVVGLALWRPSTAVAN
ncbi:MAG: hypothetical protein H6852_05275 [Geminicoccaceae bacterium]|jgi:hypothetical protein|nr:hypothetical protein [Geminicoccaceae bacterium]MCB9967033.1 hypothetical protein [Geminicoccaceae bacterium]HRY24209.1 hypothetical protein [Geminicoccaceae bacterium]